MFLTSHKDEYVQLYLMERQVLRRKGVEKDEYIILLSRFSLYINQSWVTVKSLTILFFVQASTSSCIKCNAKCWDVKAKRKMNISVDWPGIEKTCRTSWPSCRRWWCSCWLRGICCIAIRGNKLEVCEFRMGILYRQNIVARSEWEIVRGMVRVSTFNLGVRHEPICILWRCDL